MGVERRWKRKGNLDSNFGLGSFVGVGLGFCFVFSHLYKGDDFRLW